MKTWSSAPTGAYLCLTVTMAPEYWSVMFLISPCSFFFFFNKFPLNVFIWPPYPSPSDSPQHYSCQLYPITLRSDWIVTAARVELSRNSE